MLTQMEQARPKQAPPCPTLVLGLGNILLRDEGVGVRVVEALQRKALPPGVELFDGATAGLDLVDVLAELLNSGEMDALGRFANQTKRIGICERSGVFFTRSDASQLAQAKAANGVGQGEFQQVADGNAKIIYAVVADRKPAGIASLRAGGAALVGS